MGDYRYVPVRISYSPSSPSWPGIRLPNLSLQNLIIPSHSSLEPGIPPLPCFASIIAMLEKPFLKDVMASFGRASSDDEGR